MKKKIASAVVLSLTILSGCGNNASSSSVETTTVEVITTEPIDEEASRALEIVKLYTPKSPSGTRKDYEDLSPTLKYDVDNYVDAFMNEMLRANLNDSVVNTDTLVIRLFNESYKHFSRVKVYRDCYQLTECHNFYLQYLNYDGTKVVCDEIYQKYMDDLNTIMEKIMETYYL